MTPDIPSHLSARKRLLWVLYRHGFHVDEEGRGVCQCGGWSAMGGSRGTWEEHVADLVEEAVNLLSVGSA